MSGLINGTTLEFRIHLRSMLDRIGVLNTKFIKSEQLKIEINKALIESSTAIDLTRLHELMKKLSKESPVVDSINRLQSQLNQWFIFKEKNQSDPEVLSTLLLLFEQINQQVQSLGDEDIRHRIEISVNNIRNSICHISTADTQLSTLLLGIK